ncbi:VOC family protein [Ferruginibacter profundus]
MKATQFRIARPTDRLKEVVRFYHDALELPIIGSFENHAGYDGVMFGLPGVQYHLEFTQYKNPSPCPAPTKDNLLVLYFETTLLYNEAIVKLISLGYAPVAPENPYWLNKSETFEDPDGWRIVLFNGIYKQ